MAIRWSQAVITSASFFDPPGWMWMAPHTGGRRPLNRIGEGENASLASAAP
ncbi:MAG: hypothetical protein U0935_05975 [Pirellulales bacterium]